MASEIPLVMPKMSMTMTEGIVVAWHKRPGDEVRSGDVVAEVTTDKVDMEVESPVDGVLARLAAEPEDVVSVGEPIAYLTSDTDDLIGDLLGGPGSEDPAPTEPARTLSAEAAAEEQAAAEEGPAAERGTAGEAAGARATRSGVTPLPSDRSRVTPLRSGAARAPAPAPAPARANGWVPSVPLARVRAQELGADLATLTPTGPGGVVRVRDVEAAARPHPRSGVAAGTATAVPTRRRAALARRMTESAAVPQFVVFRDLDLDALAAARGGVGWTAVLLTAFAAVLRADPVLHASWDGDRRRPHDDVIVSVALDTPEGLLGPSLVAPDRLPVREVDAALRALAERADAGRLAVADLTPGTTTVSDLGALGVDAFSTLLTPPQATALTLGTVGPVPVAVPGGLGVRVRCRAGLVVDHRVGDGADAARLLDRLQRRCDDPASLGL